MNKFVVKLTMAQAEQLGIVVCKDCGHPRNNHFTPTSERRCAHCSSCRGYKPNFTTGTVIEE